MLNRVNQCLAILAVFAFSMPLFARSDRISQPLDLTQPATIGSTTLQPGHYSVVANLNSDQVRVKNNQDGKFVATIEGRTVTLNNKSPYSAIVMNGQSIHEIQFAGKAQAIEIPRR